MNDQDEALRKARQFADSTYADALNRNTKEFQEKLALQRNQLAARGIILSGAMSKGTAELCGKRIDDLVQARLDSLLEGYDLYGVPLDDQRVSSTIDEVMSLKDTLLLNASKSVAKVDLGIVGQEMFAQLLQSESMISRATVIAQVERKRQSKPKEASVMNVYHLTGAGSRVNVNSTDNSTNVTITAPELFSKMRKEITEKVSSSEERDRLLQRVSALEKERELPSVWDRYKELIAVASDHMTIICPFIPALTEMMGKAIR